MRRRGRAGEIEHLLDPGQLGQRVDDIRFDQLEARLAPQVVQVSPPPGLEVVEADHPGALAEEGVAEVGTDEAAAAGNQDKLALAIPHEINLFSSMACATRAGGFYLAPNVSSFALVRWIHRNVSLHSFSFSFEAA